MEEEEEILCLSKDEGVGASLSHEIASLVGEKKSLDRMVMAKTLKRLRTLPGKEDERHDHLEFYLNKKKRVSVDEFVERYLGSNGFRRQLRLYESRTKLRRDREPRMIAASPYRGRKPRIRIPSEEETLTMRNYNSMANMEEFVNKLSSNKWSFISWNERCLVLNHERKTLTYYKSKKKRNFNRQVRLDDIVWVGAAKEQHTKGRKHCFEIHERNDSSKQKEGGVNIYVASCSKESSKLQWIRVIATCCLLRAVHNSASTERIRVFADSGADLNATDPTDKEHRPALLIALQRGNMEAVHFLLRSFARPHCLLRWRTLQGMPPALRPNELLELLLNDGVSLNVRGDDVRKWTILHHLCYVGDVEGLQTALKHVNTETVLQKDSEGDTAFAIALKRLYRSIPSSSMSTKRNGGDEEEEDLIATTDVTRDEKGEIASGLVERLMKNAKKDECDGRGDTLVRLAIEAGRDDLASNLIADKFDFESKSPKDGNSAFHLAVKMNAENLVKDMLRIKIKNVNSKDGNEDTSLIHAVTNQNLNICAQLLEAGANPNAVSSAGYSCIAIALDLGNEDIACLLTKYGARADLASAAYKSDTVFLTAIRMRFRRLAEMMLRRHKSPSYAAQGEDINATLTKLLTSRGVDGETPLLQAVRHGCFVLANDIVLAASKLPKSSRSKILDAQVLGGGDNATMRLLRCGMIELASILVDSGCDVNTQTSNGETLLHLLVHTSIGGITPKATSRPRPRHRVEAIYRRVHGSSNRPQDRRWLAKAQRRFQNSGMKLLDSMILEHGERESDLATSENSADRRRDGGSSDDDDEDQDGTWIRDVRTGGSESGGLMRRPSVYYCLLDIVLQRGGDALATLDETQFKWSPLHSICNVLSTLKQAKDDTVSLATRVATRIIHANNDASLVCDTRGYTPLSLAISLARLDSTLSTEFASVLIRESDPAALSTDDDGGNTPIHIAVSVGNARLARELLIRGSYGASWNHDGEAPIHIVAKSGNSKLLKVLAEGGCHLSRLTESGETAAFTALRHANAELLHELADSGADLSLRLPHSRKNALDVAASICSERMQMFLTPRGMSGGADMEKKIVRTMKVVILLAESGHFTISSSKFSRSGVAASMMRSRALETISQYILSAGQVIANTPPPPLPSQKTKPSLNRVLSKQDTIQINKKEEEKEEEEEPPIPPPRPPNMSELKRRMSMKATKKKEEEKRKDNSPHVRRKSAKLGEGDIKSEGLICPSCKGVFATVSELLEHGAQCTVVTQELKQKDELSSRGENLNMEEEKKEQTKSSSPIVLSRKANSLTRDSDIASSSSSSNKNTRHSRHLSNLHSMDGTSDTNYQILDLRVKLSELRRSRVSAVVIAECETRARARRWLQTSSGRQFLFKRATELMKSRKISESEAIRDASDDFVSEKAKQDGEEVSKAYRMKIRRLEANFRAQRRVGV